VAPWDVVATERQAEYERVTASLGVWAAHDSRIVGLAIVGSWPRGDARMTSDVDVVVLSDTVDYFVRTDRWVGVALPEPAEIVRTAHWGALTERRTRLASGLEVEFGFATRRWGDTGPVDSGTAGVIAAGCEIVHDPERLLAAVVAATTAVSGARRVRRRSARRRSTR
jgi:nucleotidyltransferase-like protein